MKQRKSKSRILTDKGRIIRPGLLEKYSIKSTDPSGSQQVPEDPFTGVYGQYGLVEPIYNPTSLITLTEVNVYHNRCCKQKALDVAGSGWTLNATEEGKGNQANYNKLKEFFQNVPYDTWMKAHQDLEEVGYACVELIRYQNSPKADYKTALHIPAHTVRIHKDKSKFMQERGTGRVWFKNVEYNGEIDNRTGEELSPESIYRANELLYITNHTARSDFYGFPDSIPAIPTMYGEQGRATYNVSFFENFGIPTYAITITGDFDEGDRDDTTGLTDLEFALQEQLQAIQSNPHSTMVISVPSKDGLTGESQVSVDFKQLSVETKEASFRLYRMDNRDEVITAHGMDPYRIGVMVEGSLGGNTAIESKKNYKNGTIQPRQEMWEDRINKYICRDGFGVTDYVFQFNAIDLEDEASDLSLLKDLFMMGAVTPSQLIGLYGERFGLEEASHPALDAHYINNIAIDYTPPAPVDGVDVVKQLESLRERLVEVADKYADNNGTDKGSGLYHRITKKLTT